MAITRVHVDRQLLEEAKQVFEVRTDTEAIDLALRETILRRR